MAPYQSAIEANADNLSTMTNELPINVANMNGSDSWEARMSVLKHITSEVNVWIRSRFNTM